MKIGWWMILVVMGAAAAQDCGAVTLEPLPPEEPFPEAAAPPRLVRREAGAVANRDAGRALTNDNHD